MRLLFSLLLLLSGYWLAAQSGGTLRVEPADILKEIRVDNLDEDFEDVTAVVVTNNSGRTLQLIRETVGQKRPRAWSFRTLDRLSRSAPYVLSADEQASGRAIPLGPGQSATFFVVLRPDGVAGRGSTELRFSDLTLPGRVLGTATISARILQEDSAAPDSPADSRPPVTSVHIYPNPATDRFFVEAPRGTEIGRVEMTNTLGRQLRTFEGESSTDGFDIRNLPDGLYLISIYDRSGKKLKTIRLLHRQFGA